MPSVMSAADFEAAAARTQQKETARGMARLVLLDGLSAAEAGRRYGRTRETARAAAARVLREYREAGGYPRDWVTMTVTVPRHVADNIAEQVHVVHRAAGLEL